VSVAQLVYTWEQLQAESSVVTLAAHWDDLLEF